jgi:hypothetical protein
MLTCFDLKPKHTIEEFQKSLDNYSSFMQEHDLGEGHSPIGLRQSDTILDTDDERKHKYFMLMHFRDREQSDKAVAYIKSHKEPGKSLHTKAYSQTQNLIFISWQDIEE